MSELSPPQPIPEAGPVDFTRFQNEIRPARRPVVVRGLADDWPGVAAARAGDREIAEYLLEFRPTRDVGAIMLPAENEGRFFYNADMTAFNFTPHQGRLSAFLG